MKPVLKLLIGIIFCSLGLILLFGSKLRLSSSMNTELDSKAYATAVVPDESDYTLHNSREYSFEYPYSWFIKDTPLGVRSFVLTTISNYDENFYNNSSKGAVIANLSKITIAKIPKNTKVLFSDWIKEYVARGKSEWGSEVLEESTTYVDGHDAILHIEQLGILASPVMYIDHSDSVYIIIGGAFDKALDDIFYRFVDSFHFLP